MSSKASNTNDPRNKKEKESTSVLLETPTTQSSTKMERELIEHENEHIVETSTSTSSSKSLSSSVERNPRNKQETNRFRRNDVNYYVHLDYKGRSNIGKLNKLSIDEALSLVEKNQRHCFTLGYFRKALYDKHKISTPHLKFLVRYFQRFPDRVRLTALEKHGVFLRLEWVKVRVLSMKGDKDNMKDDNEEIDTDKQKEEGSNSLDEVEQETNVSTSTLPNLAKKEY